MGSVTQACVVWWQQHEVSTCLKTLAMRYPKFATEDIAGSQLRSKDNLSIQTLTAGGSASGILNFDIKLACMEMALAAFWAARRRLGFWGVADSGGFQLMAPFVNFSASSLARRAASRISTVASAYEEELRYIIITPRTSEPLWELSHRCPGLPVISRPADLVYG